MKTVLSVVGGVALCAAFAGTQTARANFLTNGSLETGLPVNQFNLVTPNASQNNSALPGWTITSGSINIVPNTYWQSTDGTFSVDLIGTSGIGTIAQTVSTIAGTDYTLTFDFAVNPETLTGEIGSTKNLVVTATSASSAIDGTQLFSGTAGAATRLNLLYTQMTFDFTATSSLTTLSMAATMPGGLPGSFNSSNVYCGPIIDNLDLELAGSSTPPGVPEPASLGLLGLGAVGLLRRRSVRTGR